MDTKNEKASSRLLNFNDDVFRCTLEVREFSGSLFHLKSNFDHWQFLVNFSEFVVSN